MQQPETDLWWFSVSCGRAEFAVRGPPETDFEGGVADVAMLAVATVIVFAAQLCPFKVGSFQNLMEL